MMIGYFEGGTLLKFSNLYSCEFTFLDITWPSVQHAYKCLSEPGLNVNDFKRGGKYDAFLFVDTEYWERRELIGITALRVKESPSTITEKKKRKLLHMLLFSKFSQHDDLRKALCETHEKVLTQRKNEDPYICDVLMEVRDIFVNSGLLNQTH